MIIFSSVALLEIENESTKRANTPMNPNFNLYFVSFTAYSTPYAVPETVKNEYLDRNHLDLLWVPSKIHILTVTAIVQLHDQI